MTRLYLMKTKGEMYLLFQKFHKMVKNQYNKKIQTLCNANSEEYQSFDCQ